MCTYRVMENVAKICQRVPNNLAIACLKCIHQIASCPIKTILTYQNGLFNFNFTEYRDLRLSSLSLCSVSGRCTAYTGGEMQMAQGKKILLMYLEWRALKLSKLTN